MFQDGSIEEWRNVFYLSACVMMMFSVPYLFFGSGELQPWNNVMAPKPKSSVQQKDDESQETKT